MRIIDLGNNEQVSIGVRKVQDQYIAMTTTQSKIFLTERGANKWLERKGCSPNGNRV